MPEKTSWNRTQTDQQEKKKRERGEGEGSDKVGMSNKTKDLQKYEVMFLNKSY